MLLENGNLIVVSISRRRTFKIKGSYWVIKQMFIFICMSMKLVNWDGDGYEKIILFYVFDMKKKGYSSRCSRRQEAKDKYSVWKISVFHCTFCYTIWIIFKFIVILTLKACWCSQFFEKQIKSQLHDGNPSSLSINKTMTKTSSECGEVAKSGDW